MNKDILLDLTYGMNFNKDKFITPENHEFKFNNENYTAIFDKAIEEDNNGYIVHNVSLVKNDILVGYLRFFYLPEENANHYFENILYYLQTRGNSFGLSKIKKKIDLDPEMYGSFEDKNQHQKVKTIKSVAMSVSYNYYSNVKENIENLISNKDDLDNYLNKEYKNLIKLMEKKHNHEFKDYKKRYVDKPMTEFIKIRGCDPENDRKEESMYLKHKSTLLNLKKYCDDNNLTLEHICRKSEENYRGKGLGKVLYKNAADWISLNGLKLHRCGTNEFSEPLWSHVFKKYPDMFNIEKNNDRIYLDHAKFDKSYLKIKEEKVVRKKAIKLK